MNYTFLANLKEEFALPDHLILHAKTGDIGMTHKTSIKVLRHFRRGHRYPGTFHSTIAQGTALRLVR